MKEIGGYIELEHYCGDMLHENGILLDCGRNCLAYLICAKNIKKIAIPYFMCETARVLCEQYGVEIEYYHIGYDFHIAEDFVLESDTWLYFVNYYGQFSPEEIVNTKRKYERVIVDNAQAYFDEPLPGVDTLYTCRKFFGVPDGGILFTDRMLAAPIEKSFSYDNMAHLLGRYEKGGSAFFAQSIANNDRFLGAPLRSMSKLTKNLLHSIDYQIVKQRRTDNYRFLHEHLKGINELELREVEGAFAYPLLVANGAELKKTLIQNKIYIPTLWPNVLEEMGADSTEYRLASDILPIPCDQRYGTEEMKHICALIERYQH